MFQCMHPLKLLPANLLRTEMNFVVVVRGLLIVILNVTSPVKLHVGEHKGAWNQARYHAQFQFPFC